MKNMLFCIGEALIDFIPDKAGCSFHEIQNFSPAVGGAPANVCAAFARLGGSSALLTQVGDDPFGQLICQTLSEYGIDTQYIKTTKAAKTALAFVTLGTDGDRQFSFYRDPSADMLYPADAPNTVSFQNAFGLHFCSVALGNTPMGRAHDTAIRLAAAENAIISFDVNLRLPLWPDSSLLRKIVLQYAPKAHILKLSAEELAFLTGTTEISSALPTLFSGCTELILYTCGSGGAYAFTKNAQAFSPAVPVPVQDTTGAGDAFVGAFLYQLCQQGITPEKLPALSEETLSAYLRYACHYCSLSIQKSGAIPSYPTQAEMTPDF